MVWRSFYDFNLKRHKQFFQGRETRGRPLNSTLGSMKEQAATKLFTRSIEKPFSLRCEDRLQTITGSSQRWRSSSDRWFALDAPSLIQNFLHFSDIRIVKTQAIVCKRLLDLHEMSGTSGFINIFTENLIEPRTCYVLASSPCRL